MEKLPRDITGCKIGKLTVISRVAKPDNIKKTNTSYWFCRCECGNEKVIARCGLTNGTKSCGCLRANGQINHGMRDTRFYQIWQNMKSRCLNPNVPQYCDYGGRGIDVCESWHTFENFMNDMHNSYLKHADKYGERETTLERIDVNGNYELNNCKWATYIEQANNRRNNKK